MRIITFISFLLLVFVVCQVAHGDCSEQLNQIQEDLQYQSEHAAYLNSLQKFDLQQADNMLKYQLQQQQLEQQRFENNLDIQRRLRGE